jgi:predicted ArsR family transcriptional regulator
MSLEIKDSTVLAVIEKATQVAPAEYCVKFLDNNEQVGESLSTLAVTLAQMVSEDGDMESLMLNATAISSAMFMTYEMANAEVEAKELEDLFDA